MRRQRFSLRLEDWPAADREAFERAFRVGVNPFDDDHGPGAHLRPTSIALARDGYGRWLRYLTDNDPSALQMPFEERVTRERIERYAQSFPSITDTTRSLYVRAVYDALRYMRPGADWQWLRRILSRLEGHARPQPRPFEIDSARLQEVGLGMIDEARQQLASIAPEDRRRLREVCELWRDGLLIVFLTVLPLRRSNVAQLEVGSTIVHMNATWTVEIPGSISKSGRPIESALPAWFGAHLDSFLYAARCRFPGAAEHRSLWPSWRGGALGSAAIYAGFVRRVRERTGITLRLHDVRSIAATTLSILGPSEARAASTLLGHTSPRTTEQFYVRGHTVQAARLLSSLIGRR